MTPPPFDSPFSSPGFRLDVSPERRAELERSNRLKQERYAKQKTIQFSRLLERSSDQIEEYVESQKNVFLVDAPPADDAVSDDANVNGETPELDAAEPDAETTRSDDAEPFDRDDVDDFFDPADDVFFASKPFFRYDRPGSAQEEFAFDPAARAPETLRDRLLEQLRLDGKRADLSPKIRELCEAIVDRLDANGFLTADAPERSTFEDRDITALKSTFDAIFDVDATPETLAAAGAALDARDAASSKSARDAARRRFDAAVGRKTTAEERDAAKKAFDEFARTSPDGDAENAGPADPLDALFPKKPSKKERENAEKALAVVQSLDPPGVGARSLQESLLLRVRDDLPNADALRRIVADAFDDFQKKRISAIVDKTGIPFATVVEIYESGFPFHPAPSSLFSDEPTRWIRPEIFLDRSPSGRWLARLDDARPEFRLDPVYRKMLLAKNVDKTTKEYLRRQYVDATALLDALQNRDSTVLRVAQAAVDFQYDYFDDSQASPRPLTLRQIADKIGVDPSTVSRACVDKWLETPRGFVPLKSLFPKAVSGDSSSSNVERRLRELIDGEDRANPLGDDALAAELRRRFQIDVSRKTVQERRERLGIPNSRARKRLFRESGGK